MSIDAVMLVLFLLGTKHMVVDGPLQSHFPYLYEHKGEFLHPGGLMHAGLHGVGTLIVLALFPGFLGLAVVMGLADFLIHYIVDWSKMRLNAINGWNPTKPHFWTAILVDQYAHYLTYLGIAGYVAKVV